MRWFAAAVSLSVALPSASLACGSTEEWYFENVEVVFEASARCDLDERTCRVRVNRVLKNPKQFALAQRNIRVDFHNWYADNPSPEGAIVMRCGYPLFEPEQRKFRARFYADIDKKSGELRVRKLRYLGEQAE